MFLNLPISLRAAAFATAVCAVAPLHADPVAEMASFSVFKNVDVNKLAAGKPMIQRGATMGFARGLAIEACYVVRKPVARTRELHLQWEPSRHPEMKVYLHTDLSAKPAPDEFKKLASAPSNSSVKSFAAATQKLGSGSSDLQLSAAEAKSFGKDGGASGGALPGPAAAFWSNVLFQRASAFLSGGMGKLPPYETAKETIRPAEEVARLLKETPKIRGQFSALLEATPILGAKSSLPASPYWELFDVEGQGAVSLGALYVKPAGDAVQIVDAQYYSSGGYYVYLSLFQMWPVKAGGQDATLVWRGDLLSSGNLAELHGMERMGSSAAMMRVTQKAIDLFQKDAAEAK
ncbi:MAG TPA: hypothetical protein VEO95_01600 [Chthoniobacteraceae bacterium]|nr:hypothetical protein [Chthoniobacteraceae bacterium]